MEVQAPIEAAFQQLIPCHVAQGLGFNGIQQRADRKPRVQRQPLQQGFQPAIVDLTVTVQKQQIMATGQTSALVA